ncbi:MAG: putative phage abortive infection protein [Candidatus Kryptoniota bacterium]
MEPSSKDKESQQNKLNHQITRFTRIAFFFAVLGFCVVIYGVYKYYPFSTSNLTDLGTFLAGLLGPVWALAGVLFFYAAFLEQKLQLLYQEGEMEEQNETLRLQRFETSFFELLKFHNDIVDSLNFSWEVHLQNLHGRNCFETLYGLLKDEYEKSLTHSALNPNEIIQLAWRKFFDTYEAKIGHYFRNLYNITKFVDENAPSKDDKIRYVNLIRAQLSTYEQLLLWYNCLDIIGMEFKPLVKTYNLVKNVRKKKLLDPSRRNLYDGIELEEEENERIANDS